jgi:aminoglycoside phosphotransferase (APT) family kinase protein
MEAQALQFVSRHTSIPVPKLYDFWRVGDEAYLTMEYIDGDRLDRKWRSLTEEQRDAVKSILRGYIDELRAVKQPEPSGWIGSIDGGETSDFRTGSAIFGPFSTVSHFHDWRIASFSWFGEQHAPTARRLEELRLTMRDDCRVVLTHGDIHKRNVLIKVHGEGPKDVSVVALLDWEQCGWRPEYWEVAKISFGPQGKDWAGFYPGYRAELAIENELLYISGPPR